MYVDKNFQISDIDMLRKSSKTVQKKQNNYVIVPSAGKKNNKIIPVESKQEEIIHGFSSTTKTKSHDRYLRGSNFILFYFIFSTIYYFHRYESQTNVWEFECKYIL